MALSAILTLGIVLFFSVMGSKVELTKFFGASLFLFFSIDELRRAILILVKHRIEYVFAARLGFFIFRLILPTDKYKIYLKNYIENTMKFAAKMTLLGAPLLFIIGIFELVN